MNNVIEKKIKRIENDIIRYKEYLRKDLESDNLNEIENTLRSFSNDILSMIKVVEELKDIQSKL